MRDGIPTWEWRDIGTANRGWLLGHLYEAALDRFTTLTGLSVF